MTQASNPLDVETAAPVPALSGTFAMFETPGGGLRFVVRFAEHGERYLQLPPMMARPARARIAKFIADGQA